MTDDPAEHKIVQLMVSYFATPMFRSGAQERILNVWDDFNANYPHAHPDRRRRFVQLMVEAATLVWGNFAKEVNRRN